jgi:hypothetical protein
LYAWDLTRALKLSVLATSLARGISSIAASPSVLGMSFAVLVDGAS